jgi:glucose/arabinose dehydrogenase
MRLPLVLLLGQLALAAGAQERIDYARELPPVEPREPREALATFRVEPGFRIELVAAEPLIADPVELAFDEQGRLWILEFAQYNQEFPGGDPNVRGKLKVLRDTDGDGAMDTAVTFAENLNYASAFASVRRRTSSISRTPMATAGPTGARWFSPGLRGRRGGRVRRRSTRFAGVWTTASTCARTPAAWSRGPA